MAESDIERRVRALEDREAIRELPHHYCDRVWHHAAKGLEDLFTEDCWVDLGSGVLKGRDAIRDFMSAVRGDDPPRPMIHNILVELAPDGQTATGRCSVHIAVTIDGEDRTMLGFYEDEYAREDGRWKFRSRKAHLHDWSG